MIDTDVPQELIEKTGPIPGLDLVEEDMMDIDKADLLDQRKSAPSLLYAVKSSHKTKKKKVKWHMQGC